LCSEAHHNKRICCEPKVKGSLTTYDDLVIAQCPGVTTYDDLAIAQCPGITTYDDLAIAQCPTYLYIAQYPGII
jgi:hypothetical protein